MIVVEGGPEEAEAMASRLKEAVQDYDPGLHHPKLGRCAWGSASAMVASRRTGLDCDGPDSGRRPRMYENKTESKLGALVGKEGSCGSRVSGTVRYRVDLSGRP